MTHDDIAIGDIAIGNSAIGHQCDRPSVLNRRRAGFSCAGLLRAGETHDDGRPRDMLAFARIKEPTR